MGLAPWGDGGVDELRRALARSRRSRSGDEGDLNGLRRVESAHANQHRVLAVSELEVAGLTGGEATLTSDTGRRATFATPGVVGHADITVGVRGATTVALRETDRAAKTVAIKSLSTGVQTEAGVRHVLRSERRTGEHDAEGRRRKTGRAEAKVRAVAGGEGDGRPTSRVDARRVAGAV